MPGKHDTCIYISTAGNDQLCSQIRGFRVYGKRGPFSLSFCVQQQDVEDQPNDWAMFLPGMMQKVLSLGKDRALG